MLVKKKWIKVATSNRAENEQTINKTQNEPTHSWLLAARSFCNYCYSRYNNVQFSPKRPFCIAVSQLYTNRNYFNTAEDCNCGRIMIPFHASFVMQKRKMKKKQRIFKESEDELPNRCSCNSVCNFFVARFRANHICIRICETLQ